MTGTTRRTFLTAVATAALGAAATACSNTGTSGKNGGGDVTVFAAASMGPALEEIKAAFAKAHPDHAVRLNLGSSSTLVTQLRGGAPGDVFVSADEPNMRKAVDARLVDGEPKVFARNLLSLIVEKGNPKKIKGLADLRRTDLTVAMCGPQVPVGRYGRQALQKAGVPVPKGAEELDVKQVVSRVTLREADVGVVYVTDVKAAGAKAEGVAVPAAHNVEARYPVGLLTGGGNTAGGRLFVDFLLSAQAQAVLKNHGFLAPA